MPGNFADAATDGGAPAGKGRMAVVDSDNVDSGFVDSGNRDSELVLRAHAGDEAAFALLYARHAHATRAIIGSIVRDRASQEDLLQDAFLRAFSRLGDLRETTRFRPWLLRTARHIALDHLRQRSRRPELVELDRDPLSGDATPEEMAELEELVASLRGAAVRLTRRDAVALSLTVQFGMGPQELATALGVTPNNAKVILHRARLRLRAAAGLGGHGTPT